MRPLSTPPGREVEYTEVMLIKNNVKLSKKQERIIIQDYVYAPCCFRFFCEMIYDAFVSLTRLSWIVSYTYGAYVCHLSNMKRMIQTMAVVTKMDLTIPLLPIVIGEMIPMLFELIILIMAAAVCGRL